MNVFIRTINEQKIASENDLRRLFWLLAKKTHPDVSKGDDDGKLFVQLKSDYEESLVYYRNRTVADRTSDKRPGREECIALFIDLLASNFPVDRSIRNGNKLYLSRMEQLNRGVGSNLFYRFEEEMYILKGKTVVSNHPFSLVKLYLNRFRDFSFQPNRFNRSYLTIGYDQIRRLFEDKNMTGSLKFLNWLLEGVL